MSCGRGWSSAARRGMSCGRLSEQQPSGSELPVGEAVGAEAMSEDWERELAAIRAEAARRCGLSGYPVLAIELWEKSASRGLRVPESVRLRCREEIARMATPAT